MRFFNAPGASNDTTTGQNADVVVQIGKEKTALNAAQLLGADAFFSHGGGDLAPSNPDNPHGSTPEVEIKAMEVLASMKAALQVPPNQHSDADDGPWSPFSPDDCYPYDSQPKRMLSNNDSESLPRLAREPSDANLPASYDPVEKQPSCIPQQTSAPSVRDMALHKGSSTTFDNLAYSLIGVKKSHAPRIMYGKTLRPSKSKLELKTKPLDLAHILPLPKQTNARPRSRSTIGMTDGIDMPLTSSSSDRKLKKTKPVSTIRPTTSGSGAAGRTRPFDEDILDQHKTNVRRPPKGIQNWFDAYLDDDDEDEDREDDEKLVQQEPQELPAEEVLPAAYNGPEKQSLRASDPTNMASRMLHDSHHPSEQALDQVVRRPALSRASSSDTSNSIQSSHLGQERRRITASDRCGTSTLGGDSVLSLTESEYENETDDDAGTARGRRPMLRDSILNAREITIANASSVDIMRLQRPTQLDSIRPHSQGESKRSSQRSSGSIPSIYRREKPLPLPPLHQNQAYDAIVTEDAISLRRLNGLSLESDLTSGTTNTSNTDITGGTQSSDPEHDSASPLHDPSHIMAVTEEEKMLLDLIRQRGVAMQQLSFTEGYQLALRTEQQRQAKRTASAEQYALRSLKQRDSSGQPSEEYRASYMSANAQTPTQETEMRRQLSARRKQQVDEKFQIERFSGMSRPQPLSSHPPDDFQVTRSRAPSGETLPATTYSPVVHSSPSSSNYEVAPGYFSADECESEAARMRVKQFISSKGAPPPLNSGIKTMRRRTSHQVSSIPPSPVAEHEPDRAPPLPLRHPDRPSCRYHERNVSQYTVSTLHGTSSSSVYDEPPDPSPVSTFSGGLRRLPSDSPMITTQHEGALLPPKPEAPTHAQFVSKSSSTPRLSFSAVSPLGNLINNASKVAVRTSAYTPDSVESLQHADKAAGDKQSERRAMLHRLNTVDSVLDDSKPGARESVLSITSAGEEVLGAWAELGGGRDGLQVKRRT